MAKKKQKKTQTGQQFLSPEQFLKQRARTLEIGTCYISGEMTECGEGIVFVTRKHTGGRITVAVYLIDIYCVGLKDSYYRFRMDEDELEEMLYRFSGVEECSYEEAHNWVYGAISWAEEAGIEPDKSFAITKYMLEEDTDDIPLIEYEFGYQGKHFLMANNNMEASRYLPLMKKNLGEGNYEFTIKTDYEQATEWDIDKVKERSDHFEESPLFRYYGPDTEYTYCHPDYPQKLQLESPEWFYKELNSTDNAVALPESLTRRIMELPHDSLRRDLEQIVLYHIGQTCDDIPDDYEPDGYTGVLANSVILLGEVGSADSSLAVVLEVMRQSNDFKDYHISDAGDYILVPTLYLLGQNRLDVLMNYIKEEGLETFCKCFVFPAVAHIAMAQPERRGEVVEWFREVLKFATKMLPKTQWIDSTLAGLMLNDLIDIQAKELLPEIREMFATGLVDEGSCGDLADVTRMIANPRHAGKLQDVETDTYKRFSNLARVYGK